MCSWQGSIKTWKITFLSKVQNTISTSRKKGAINAGLMLKGFGVRLVISWSKMIVVPAISMGTTICLSRLDYKFHDILISLRMIAKRRESKGIGLNEVQQHTI